MSNILEGVMVVREDMHLMIANTREHVQWIVGNLMDCEGEPAIHEVATQIGLLLEARQEIAWGIGDILVAVENRRDELNFPKEDFSSYIRAVSGMLGGQVGYNSIWAYYTTAKVIPSELRVLDQSFTWHCELVYLAAAKMEKGLPIDERDEIKSEIIRGMLPDYSDKTSIELKEERRGETQKGLAFRSGIPVFVDVIDRSTGEKDRFITFNASLLESGRDAAIFILSRLGLYRRGVPYVELKREGDDILQAGEGVCVIGSTELAKKAWNQVKGNLGL